MKVDPKTTALGWIGTGVMGASMCGHLLSAGYPVTIYNRTRSKAEKLEAQGATWAESPAEVAAASDITFSIVGFPGDVREVFLGENGALAGASPRNVLVDMTTSDPTLATEIAREGAALDVGTIDAPVSGGDVGARNATLSIMIGGEDEHVERVWPLFEIIGDTLVHLGGPGSGQHTKMVNQILIATAMIGVSEALLYANGAGLDLLKVLEAVSGGAAGSWSLNNLGPRMLENDFAPGFLVDHFVKDMSIALDEVRAMQLSLPGLALAHQLNVALQAQGHGHAGTQSLLLALAHLNDVTWSGRD